MIFEKIDEALFKTEGLRKTTGKAVNKIDLTSFISWVMTEGVLFQVNKNGKVDVDNVD